MNVALYARVSTSRQEKQGTIESQIAALRRYAYEHNQSIIEEYVCKDNGYSGALLARPELDRLRDGAQAGAFDAVIVLSPDRLSRKYAYLILILEEFERFGTQVIFLENTPGDDPHSALLTQIQGAVAEYERAKIAERYRRGKMYRARQGEVFWHSIPYGYRRIGRQDGIPAHLVIEDAHADVVRTIFSWHAHEEMTIRQITKRLTKEGYPTPKGNTRWGETTVHRILRRDAYLGTLYYNKSSEVMVVASDQNRRGRKRIHKPDSEWIPVSIPPIIDKQLFDRSQGRHEPNEQFSPRNLHEEHWLLRRVVRCEKCGLKCACVADKRRPHMPPAYYYRCDKQDRLTGRERCHPNHIRSEPLDALVWDQVRTHILDPRLLLKAHKACENAHCLDQSFLQTQANNTRNRLGKLELQRTRLIDMFQDGFVNKEDFHARMAILIDRIEAGKKDLTNYEVECKSASEGNRLLSRIGDFTSVIAQNIDNMSFTQKQQLVRTVLSEIVIHGTVVKIYFRIPLLMDNKNESNQSASLLKNKVSSQLNLRSHDTDAVDVGVIHEVLSPGVKNGEKGDLSAEIFFIVSKPLKRLGDCLKQKRKERFFITKCKTVKFLWNGEDDMEVMNRQKVTRSQLDPPCSLQSLAFRAVPVPAGVVRDAFVITMIAPVDMAAQL